MWTRLLILFLWIPNIIVAQSDRDIQLANEYYVNGDFEKAKDLYSILSKNSKNIPAIHNNYFNVLLSLNDFDEAEKYIKKALKVYPQNIYYQIDQGLLYRAMGQEDKAEAVFRKMIGDIKGNDFLIRTSAQYLISKQLTQYALDVYLAGRKNNKSKTTYALEIANAHRILGNQPEMIDEYLNFAGQRKNNLSYVKNILQNLLQKDEDIENFKTVLLENIQKNPNQPMYGDLLVWVHIQQKDFNGAFIQARALDKRFQEEGSRLMTNGRIALENAAYSDAIRHFEYVVENYPDGSDYIRARRFIIQARENSIKEVFPVDTAGIRKLTYEYQNLLGDLGKNASTIEAYRSKALLHAFYLHENDSAIRILQEIIQTPRIPKSIRSESKLDLGDIYLLIDEPWEATLLYSQVEKENKSTKIGYKAKLKNAQLNYYVGNFSLAKSHLDILKVATTREISNDAIALSLLIEDNTVLDTSDFTMKEFASIELIEFQNKKQLAEKQYLAMLEKYPAHSLVDEIHWRIANINIELGNFEKALLHLQVIHESYSQDILGDDAMFKMAQLYEEYLFDSGKAMEIYRAFLTTYPGSIYVSEARKKYRKLRGDNIF